MDLNEAPAELTPESYATAREYADHAIRLQPAASERRWGLARIEARACLELLGDAASRERARRQFEAARGLARRDVRIAVDEGQFLLAAGQPRLAQRLAEEALRLEPNAVPALILLAQSLIRQDPHAGPRAARLLDQAEQTADKHADARGANRYSLELLSLDRERLARLRAGL